MTVNISYYLPTNLFLFSNFSPTTRDISVRKKVTQFSFCSLFIVFVLEKTDDITFFTFLKRGSLSELK